MTAKEFLQQYRDADREINAKLDQIHRLRELATKTTTAFGDDWVQSSAENKTEKIVAKIVDLEKEVNNEINRFQNIKHEVESTIALVPDSKQRAVLTRRYISGKTWEQIAVDLNYTYRNICYIHGRALQEVDQKIS